MYDIGGAVVGGTTGAVILAATGAEVVAPTAMALALVVGGLALLRMSVLRRVRGEDVSQ